MAEERRNALTPGMEFEGYRIEGILGAGGFGVTYRATETLLDRQVAIKEYLPSGMAIREADGVSIAPIGATETADFKWGMERFRAEAQTLVNFRHPNIVTVYRYFETHGSGYLVMEYVEGRTLAELVRPDKALDEGEIHEILDPLLDGLKAVHDKGFLHRDIKPANIFIREDGSPVLIDFGAARQALGQHSKSLTSVVSAGYAPYEQYDSTSDQGPWTDLYALGGVLYRCVTGKVPPEAPARVSAVFDKGTDPLTDVHEAAQGSFSEPLLMAIDSALAIRQSERPQSVAAFRTLVAGPGSGSGAEEKAAATADSGATGFSGAGDQPTLMAGSPAAPTPSVPAQKKAGWKVAVPAAIVLLGAGAGAWALIANSGESRACLRLAKQMDAAVGKTDLGLARQHLNAGRVGGCSKEMIADLNAKTQGLAARLAAAAERKRQEAARKRAEVARRKALAEAEWKKLVLEKNALIEAERQKAAAEAERKRQEVARQRAAEARRKALAETEWKKLVLEKNALIEAQRKKAAAESERKRLVEERRIVALKALRNSYSKRYRLKCVAEKTHSESDCKCIARLVGRALSLEYIEYNQKQIKIFNNKNTSNKEKLAKYLDIRKKFGVKRLEKLNENFVGKIKSDCGVDVNRKKGAKSSQKQTNDEDGKAAATAERRRLTAARRKAAAIVARHLSECRWGWNGKVTVSWQSRIEACSAIIDTKSLTGRKLAAVYYFRGIARREISAKAAAKDDFQTALRLDSTKNEYREALVTLDSWKVSADGSDTPGRKIHLGPIS